ncbi:glycosyltransferase [Candidatus Roizmanbacteria bacterium]|nr:glycosyltransferase [Candidatus Roizmanbacteria bacterium]
MALEKARIAVVYDWFDKWGGVERVLLTIAEMFPHAEFYTSYFDKKEASWGKNLDITTSFMQKLPSFIKKRRVLSLSFYPYAFEAFDFSDYALVLSISSSFAKAVITKPETLHLSYLLTPTRYFWIDPDTYLNTLLKKLGYALLPKLRKWDYIAAQRPDYMIAISKTVAARCRKYYDREAEMIYPPFNLDYWQKVKFEIRNSKFGTNSKFTVLNSKFYLVVARLEPYKKVGLVVEVFNRLGESLVIVGKGSEIATLKRTAKNNVTFFSDLSDEDLAGLYQNAQALIMPQEEEFGYVSLEAQYFGCPVIAYEQGGAGETVIDGKTGIFFEKQASDALSWALERFRRISYNLRVNTKRYGPESAKKFAKERFISDFNSFINSKLKVQSAKLQRKT